jgi:polar amino acid transport system ATP-binding protein
MTDEKNVVLKVRGLKKSFGSLEVLKGVDVDIHKGEVVVVIGPSGSGKSTFLRCLNLLEKPSEGDIEYHGKSILHKDMKIDEYREKNRNGLPAVQSV